MTPDAPADASADRHLVLSNVERQSLSQGTVTLRSVDTSRSTHALTTLDLRYLLTVHLLEAEHSLSISELVALVESDGFALPGRASKTVSDALRWEIRRGRVVRVRRATYRVGSMPRQTKGHIRRRVRDVRSGLTRGRARSRTR